MTYSHHVSPNEFYQDIGRGRRKDLTYIYFNEGFGVGYFNRFRYIGKPIGLKKNNHTIRIALLGDSYVESFLVFQRNYFGEIAEKILEKKFPYKKIEILNFGRSGSDVGDLYVYYHTFVKKFHPDLTVLILSKEDLFLKYSDPLRPKAMIKNDSLTISYDFNPGILRTYQIIKPFLQNSAFINMVNSARKKLKNTFLPSLFFGKFASFFSSPSEDSLHINWQKKPLSLISKKILCSFDENTIIINRDIDGPLRDFVSLKDSCDINFYDLSPLLKKMKEEGNNPYEWPVSKVRQGHWNHLAHQKIGWYLAHILEKEIHSRESFPEPD
jgi:hypothetical protein